MGESRRNWNRSGNHALSRREYANRERLEMVHAQFRNSKGNGIRWTATLLETRCRSKLEADTAESRGLAKRLIYAFGFAALCYCPDFPRLRL